MRRSRRIFALALVAVAVTAAAGCGGDQEGKGIPSASADQLLAQLDDVQRRIDQGSVGACRDIIEAPDERGADKKQVQQVIDSLPDDVDSDVKSALQDSFDHLWDLVEQDCEDKASEQKQQNTTPTETQTETTPEQTETETTPTQPEETTPTETTPPAEEELPGGEGNGNGGGALPGAGEGGGAGPGAQKVQKQEKKK
jgi:hypothetical protein